MLTSIMARLQVLLHEVRENEEGQGLIEYALLAVLISVAAIGLMTIVGADINAVFDRISRALGGAGDGTT